jgi:heme exporter protein CcmD
MDFLAPHGGFTLAAYLVSAAALVGLTLSLLLKSRKLRRQIEERPQ